MKNSIDLFTAEITDLHLAIDEHGTPRDEARADDILKEYDAAEGAEEAQHAARIKMMALCAQVQWQHEFTLEGKAERQAIIDENLKQLNKMEAA
jgi:hypothetical protein